jgi:hypothetical protein
MKRFIPNTVLVASVVFAACADTPTGPLGNRDAILMGTAFNSLVAGYDNVTSTYAAPADGLSLAWLPSSVFGDGGGDPGQRGPGRGGPGGGGGRGPGDGHGRGGPGIAGFMGGGLDGLFHGDGFGHGHGGFGVLPASCVYTASSQRVVCPDTTRQGLTVSRSAQYRNTAGAAQTSFDSLTTNTINMRFAVSGSVTRRDSAVSTVASSSDRTVAGLAPGSTQRTVNGTSAGTENTTGTNSSGAFTARRTMGDTVTNVVIPVATAANARPYPIAGAVIRSMSATLTIAGGAPTTTARRELLTYNGTATATLVITENGVARNCTVPLPHGRPTCQ